MEKNVFSFLLLDDLKYNRYPKDIFKNTKVILVKNDLSKKSLNKDELGQV